MPHVDGVVLSHLELDLLWEDLGLGPLPYPLDVRSHGRTQDERDDLGAQVFESLRAAGLHDGQEADAALEDLLVLMSRPVLSLDALVLGGIPLRVLAAARGRRAVLAVLDREELALRPIAASSLAGVVADVLGDVPPGPGSEVRLPKEAFVEALTAYNSSGHNAFEWRLSQAGVSGRASRALWTIAASPIVGSGQLAANGPGGRSPVLTWFDTEAGRYAITTQPGTGPWVTVTPADQRWLVTRLIGLTDQVR
ncbi:hypothetical protein FHX82_001147 [Amycolatopsis bartoniae]|nr:ESX secretion-associated protein EspG [Amycolatopsis bartoniae]MBB2934127.1 hypothetical protein [Amycolatopsis bartoniae]TVT05509.1 ESX secretion-associated protein EspG [Amycolatopsis bartoniae]